MLCSALGLILGNWPIVSCLSLLCLLDGFTGVHRYMRGQSVHCITSHRLSNEGFSIYHLPTYLHTCIQILDISQNPSPPLSDLSFLGIWTCCE
ncbi:hypothetical protein BKA61DRAFT_92515 [Leptodontidium sp. MPI-SDFR-AT-0119]|nr:hypothetical protein BKA61DRAFT_92515 [Leptodontidium sp. MPI-SDFR-AT-0119]